MSDEEAKGVITAAVMQLRALTYSELVDRLADKRESAEVAGPSGTAYHLELEGFWEDDSRSRLRVVGSIDDGGLRAFLPFTDSFSISPSGSITETSPA